MNEMDTVRRFRAELAEPPDDRLARARRRLTSGVEEGHAPARGWWVRPSLSLGLGAAAAVVVAAVVAVAVAPAGAPEQAAGPGTPTGVNASQPAPAATKTASTAQVPGAAERQAGIAVLEAAAASAVGQQPLQVPVGQFLKVRTMPEEHVMWLQPRGCYPVLIQVDSEREPVGAEEAARFAAQGPSLDLPTAEFLAGLPTDPAALLQRLRTHLQPQVHAWSADHTLFDWVAGWMHHVDPLLTPAVRASLYKALALVPSVWGVASTTVGGRTVAAVAQTERDGVTYLYLDPATGRAVGQGTLFGGQPGFGLWEFSVVASAGA